MKPSLPRHRRRNPTGLFEENYRLLSTLLQEWCEEEPVLRLGVGEEEALLEIRLQERGRYTTILQLAMPLPLGGLQLPALQMELRLYHDARVAEVTAYQGCRRLPAPYQVTRHGRWQMDERRQVNLLLHELLRYCQRRGYRSLVEQDWS